MTTDQIIEKQSALIIKLLRIGQEQLQEVTNLFSEIEKFRSTEDYKEQVKEESEPKTLVPLNVIPILGEPKKICPRCKKNYRQVSKNKNVLAYCNLCYSEMSYHRRHGPNGLSKKDAILQAFSIER
jgi:hypothetical protein